MEELARTTETPAGRLASERFTAAALDPDLYPNGTAFIAADAADFPAIVARNVTERRPLAIVYPDGNEILVTPAHGVLAAALAALLRPVAMRRSKAAVHSADDAGVITLPPTYRVQLRHRAAAA